MSLSRGLYDLLITQAVARAIADVEPDVAEIERLDHGETGDGERPHAQLELINGLLRHLREVAAADALAADAVEPPARVLRAIRGAADPPVVSPTAGLAEPWLFTAGRGSPSLLNELRLEAGACDQIDILVSFITVS